MKALFLLFIPLCCFSENTLTTADRLYQTGKYSELHDYLERLDKSYDEHPSVIFFRLLFTQNADKAIEGYRTFLDTYTFSKYCDDVSLKLICLERSRGNLNKSEQLAREFLDSYPHSNHRERAEYELCFITMLNGNKQKARECFENFLSKHPQSPLVDEVIWQLEKIQETVAESLLLEAMSNKTSQYSIQIGVLGKYSNAYRVQQNLLTKFATVNIREQILGNSRLYAIFVGEFDSKDNAIEFAETHIKPHLSQYKIIEIN